MPFEYGDERKETGVDVVLEVPSGSTVPVTNVSFSEEAETSEVQFNNSYAQDIAVTGVTYSGSFEIAGRDNDLRESLWQDAPTGDVSTQVPSYVSSISIIDGEGTSYTFGNVLITSHSKDAPADDRVTESYDFTAETLNID